MGWTTLYKSPQITPEKYITSQLNWTNEKETVRPLKTAIVGRVFYAAIETITLATNERVVWAAIYPFSTQNHGHVNFAYRDQDETVGPNEVTCPIGILDMLTPTEHQRALAWRQQCRHYHATQNEKRKTTRSIKDGQRIRFAEPLIFSDGHQEAEFVFRSKVGHHKSVFQSVKNHKYYQIRGYTTSSNWSIVTD